MDSTPATNGEGRGESDAPSVGMAGRPDASGGDRSWVAAWVARTAPPSPRARLVEAVRSVLGRDVLRILEQEPSARWLTPEGIHQMRRAVPPLRGHLRLFRPAASTSPGHRP